MDDLRDIYAEARTLARAEGVDGRLRKTI